MHVIPGLAGDLTGCPAYTDAYFTVDDNDGRLTSLYGAPE